MTLVSAPASERAATRRAPKPKQGNRLPPARWVLAGLLLLVIVLLAASVAFGSRDVGWDELWRGLFGQTDDIGAAAVHRRIPRTVLALLVGISLGLAGATLQAVTRNPLADPAILGISPGAALAVVIGLTMFGVRDAQSTIWIAILGAAIAAALIVGISTLGRGRPTPLTLTLAGAATAAAFSSLTSALLLPRIDVMESFRFWQIGGVSGARFALILQVLPFLALGTLICLLSARALNAAALGDELAAGLGTTVIRTQAVAGLGAITLCGAATAIAGPIGFIGLVVPHVARLLLGTDLRRIFAGSALLGAALLIGADILGRIVARPAEIDVGIVTAVIGAPLFIALVRRQSGGAR